VPTWRVPNLKGANLKFDEKTIIETGESWKTYLEEVVPALLTAAGKALESFGESWGCHSWTNCPMAHAFSVDCSSKIPILHQPRARQFVTYFDAGWIPRPKGVPEVGECAVK